MKFTATHLTILGVILLLGFFGYAGYDNHLKNQPQPLPAEVVEEAVAEIFESDSIIEKPIVYKFKEAQFDTTGVSYWFVFGEEKQGDRTIRRTFTVEMPGPFFNFEIAAEGMYNEGKTTQVFITFFKQISEASYKSYTPYSKKY